MRRALSLLRSPIWLFRSGAWVAGFHIPIIPQLFDYTARFIYGCWLPHTVKAGVGLELGYGGLGTVIHNNSILGEHVHIGTGVTLGGNGTEFGAPTVGDNVYIGTGSKLLGPIQVGDNAVIGANAVVISDVSANSVVAGVPARVIRENIDPSELFYHLREKAG